MTETQPQAPARSGLLWLLAGIVVALGGAFWLWKLAEPRICILIYPAPPGCNSAVPYWLPYIGIALLALLLIALIVLTVRRTGMRALVGTLIAMVVVLAVFVAIMYLAFAGVFDLPQPPV
jgi:hypothetical protein